jgi:molecular chaperone HtpG
MHKGKIDVTSDNIFPIIKKYLYSDNEIFLREIVSNAVDATQKMKTLASVNEYKEDLGDLTINVSVDKKKGTITVSDHGIGMDEEEINKYINEIAFSSAEEFLEKYKDKTDLMIGKFGLGFYSVFLVADKVELYSKSYKEGTKPVKWKCEGNPEYTLEETDKKERGTEVVIHVDKESKEYLEDNKIQELLNKYCKFLPVEISFGKKKEWKDGKEIETDEPNIVNQTKPLWAQKPAELKDEDYNKFYRDLYPVLEDPLFHIHLFVDYPFNLTGILYFPKIKNNIEIQRNKIQLYCNQVFVTDSVEGIVPEFLTLLHGVLDSPDIPLNISRSYLQADSNVKKISSHITKKVADKLNDIFKNNRTEFESKWDDLKIFIEYGMLSEEKFYDKAKDFALFKNTDGNYYTFKEYDKLVKTAQTDKDKKVVYLYSTNAEQQHKYIENAKAKGYDVLLMDGEIDTHFINHLEQKLENTRFVRVDADVIDKLIPKEDQKEIKLAETDRNDLTTIFQSQLPKSQNNFIIGFESLGEEHEPVTITQTEFIRRMKDMSKMGGGMPFYGDMPDSFNLVLNTDHKLIKRIIEDKNHKLKDNLSKITEEIKPLQDEKTKLEEKNKDKKDEEISQETKNKNEELDNKINKLQDQKEKSLQEYASNNNLIKQLIDLGLLANNMLKGKELSTFVKRSVELIK